MEKQDNKSFNPDCSACRAKRLHTAEDWEKHPNSRHGYNPQHKRDKNKGWTNEALYLEWAKEHDKPGYEQCMAEKAKENEKASV